MRYSCLFPYQYKHFTEKINLSERQCKVKGTKLAFVLNLCIYTKHASKIYLFQSLQS